MDGGCQLTVGGGRGTVGTGLPESGGMAGFGGRVGTTVASELSDGALPDGDVFDGRGRSSFAGVPGGWADMRIPFHHCGQSPIR